MYGGGVCEDSVVGNGNVHVVCVDVVIADKIGRDDDVDDNDVDDGDVPMMWMMLFMLAYSMMCDCWCI